MSKQKEHSILKVGVVGTSRWKTIDKREAKAAIREAFDELQKKYVSGSTEKNVEIELISGGGAVPILSFEEAERRGWKRTCIASKAVRSTPKGAKRVTFDKWKKHGDESKYFVGQLDVFIRIGGGPQSHREMRLFRAKGKDKVIEREIKFYGR